MSLLLGLALSPFLTSPIPAYGQPELLAGVMDMRWRRSSCLSLRCNDEEWRQELATPGHDVLDRRRLGERGAGARYRAAQRRLHARAQARQSTDAYSNKWRVGTRHDVEVLRDGPNRLAVEVGAAWRLAPRSDDGIGLPGPVFRGAIDFGRRFGDRAELTQRLVWETGQGQTFIKQSMGLDVRLWPEWTLESDYVIRHRTRGASGTETAEGWFGIRRRF
ncbi:DUF481 domain-containing protein [Marilutibacter spongiae]|uniref:DUF481 domain-containing protein n=1 Tax=Marilutibacter spongiae TaxID=2025720 RepID=A0A7W3TM41_9GAMM|nr:DUF481 domain-containing protein [Lysobacter spongiae]MBB1060847.1 DUF481 domain-containing protein [Lysobacter spongiae]